MPTASRPSALRRVLSALEAATGLGALVRRAGSIPGPLSWLATPGTALGLIILAQVATGIGLAFYYAPSTGSAWGSVLHLEQEVAGGSFMRGMHAFGASAIVVLLMAHVLAIGLRRAYDGPRRINWLLGLALVPLILTFALTGYLLPWDQKGYWATQVSTGIMRGTPLVGDFVANLFQGGATLGSRTLTRFYALHTLVLPLSLAAFIALHLRILIRRRLAENDPAAVPWWPRQAVRDVSLAAFALAGVALLAGTLGAGLDAPADPTSGYPPRPEWYFAPMRELLKTIPEPWGSVVIPGLVFGVFAALPWIDGGRRPRLARALLLLPFAAWLGLLVNTTLSDKADQDYQEARVQADVDAALAKDLAKGGILARDAADILGRHPPRLGKLLFALHCQQCHVINNTGDDEALELTGYLSLNWLRGLIGDPTSPRYFGNVPELSQMEPLADEFKPKLTAIAAFVRAQDPEARASLPPALVAEGRVAYHAADCQTCHSLEPGVADLGPNLAGYGTSAWLRAFLEDPEHELFYAEDNQMPAFRDELSDEELDALVVYLRTLADPTK